MLGRGRGVLRDALGRAERTQRGPRECVSEASDFVGWMTGRVVDREFQPRHLDDLTVVEYADVVGLGERVPREDLAADRQAEPTAGVGEQLAVIRVDVRRDAMGVADRYDGPDVVDVTVCQ